MDLLAAAWIALVLLLAAAVLLLAAAVLLLVDERRRDRDAFDTLPGDGWLDEDRETWG